MRKLNQLLVTCAAALVVLLSVSNLGFAQATQVTYYHVNSQGTPVAASDGAGSPKWKQEYSNFGYHEPNVDQINDSSESNFGLAGHVEDQHDDLLLVYMQARYYDPLMGRFLSIDPAGFDEVNPQSFNRYAYANNNPHRYVDPDGNIIFLAPLAYAAATFIAKEVAVAVVSHYVPPVEYLGTRKAITGGLKYAKKKLFKGSCSFDGSTEVLTDNGYVAIRDIVVGDTVWAHDERTNEAYAVPVLDQYWNEYDKTVYIEVRNEATGEISTLVSNTIHPFFTVADAGAGDGFIKTASYGRAQPENLEYQGSIPNGSWKAAADLAAGDLLLGFEKEWTRVIRTGVVDQRLKAYNLSVDVHDNFFVRAPGSEGAGIWVHNCTSKFARRMNAQVDIKNGTATVSFKTQRATSLSSSDIDGLKSELKKKGAKNVVVNSGQVVEPTGRLRAILQKKADAGKQYKGLDVRATGNSKNEFVLTGKL